MKRWTFYSMLFALAFLISSVCALVYFLKNTPSQKESETAQFIAQTGPEKEALKTEVLAELLDLSTDQKTSLDEKQATKRLLECPLIQEAHVKKMTSALFHIDYTLRKPYVFLGDYQNLAIDKEGYPFPFLPFYTPKRMPKLYLQHQAVEWNAPIQGLKTALKLLEVLEQTGDFFSVQSIDVREQENPSLGRREIVLILLYPQGEHTLRLTPHQFSDELKCYFQLNFQEGDFLIDLRLPNLALIKRKET